MSAEVWAQTLPRLRAAVEAARQEGDQKALDFWAGKLAEAEALAQEGETKLNGSV